ncbi:MAG: efflux RND transporter periplasmic adaptor subunit [Burkholderiaceae bacterium]
MNRATVSRASGLALVLSVMLGVVLSLVPLASQSQSPRPPRAPQVFPVIVAAATQASDDVHLTLLGSGVARQSVTLYPSVAGEVAEVGFKSGQAVRAGQVMVRLVDRAQRLAVDLAAARVDAAQALASRYANTRGTGAVPESVADEADAALRAARIEHAQAAEALADRVIRAPFSGVPGIADVSVGDRVGTDTALVALDDRRVMHVDFELPEAYLSRVSAGQTVTAVNPAYPVQPFEGRIIEIDSRIDPVSRNVKVRASVPNPQDELRSGMSFQVRLQLPGQPHVSVPELALQWGREGPHVWVVRENRAIQVPARPVRRQGGRVLVDGAIRTGEPVVVEGIQRLRDGASVRVVGNGS